MSDDDGLSLALFSELLTADQLLRARIAKVLPDRMELSHFLVLNHLARGVEKTPVQLSRMFHVTRGAMTNTLGRLEAHGYVHIRPDWDDARRKLVSISPSGVAARDKALEAIMPLVGEIVGDMGSDRIRAALPVLRELRIRLET
ncbi:DNA-binding transcriptional regulator, MarR family [Roseivivax halotolerans]|uniref:DNA-binding transcriptional regulator, MarR family n=1 Tax=Roseivivax halotolerans TaxID=93684 RepID=A0A1I5V871_9RHOB|nr:MULTISPECIES: MarR family transcriptional regulator [Roseivivax]QFT64875.1 DNA-binding transcriptional repressor MarR [Roseivivax sp. THAF30]SFQ03754.1 DNA-binding transcriptional regulator, MarR family [Roseivivax halotolerans]